MSNIEMEKLLNQRFDIYLTQKIMNEVEESYKRETRVKMWYVLDDLKVQYRLIMNDFQREYDYRLPDCKLLTFVFMRGMIQGQYWVSSSISSTAFSYLKNWVDCSYYSVRPENKFSNWRDNIFTDKIRWKTHKRAMERIYENININCRKQL